MLKICSVCKVEKPIDEYRSRKDSKDGHRSNCKTCQDKSNKDYLSTLNGCITQLLGHAKENADKRNKRNDRSGEYTILRDDIKDLWNNQQQLCYFIAIFFSFLYVFNT